MFCRNCGKEVDANAIACMGCGCNPKTGDKFCAHCGAETAAGQVVCVKCGVSLASVTVPAAVSSKSRVVYVILGLLSLFFCCGLPLHNLYLGRFAQAVIQTIVVICAGVISFFLTLLTGIGGILISPVGLVILVWYVVEMCTVTTDPNGARLA